MSTKRKIPINGHGSPEMADVTAQTEERQPAFGDTAATADFAPGEAPEATSTPEAEAAGAATTALEEVAAERDALKDALLRLSAEFDNFRKRSTRELDDSCARAQGALLSDLLPVLDNLERALDAAEHHDEGKVLGGVRMTRDMFVDLLKRVGVEEIKCVDASFDPTVHDAMMMQPCEKDEGIVTAVLEKGYRQGERILRPARVAVSSGPQTAQGRTE